MNATQALQIDSVNPREFEYTVRGRGELYILQLVPLIAAMPCDEVCCICGLDRRPTAFAVVQQRGPELQRKPAILYFACREDEPRLVEIVVKFYLRIQTPTGLASMRFDDFFVRLLNK